MRIITTWVRAAALALIAAPALGAAGPTAGNVDTARLQQATGAASAAVLRLMVDANAPAAVRLRAAECVLNHAAKAIESEDIEVRVSELERAAERNITTRICASPSFRVK